MVKCQNLSKILADCQVENVMVNNSGLLAVHCTRVMQWKNRLWRTFYKCVRAVLLYMRGYLDQKNF